VRPGPALALTLGLWIASAPALADLLHLEGGGVIATEHWWVEGDTILYESGSGTVGIPRSLIVRIEPGDDAPAAAPAPEPQALPTAESDLSSRTRAARVERAMKAFEQGKAALEARDFESAGTRFLEAIREEPSLAAARIGYALSQIALGRDGLALSVVLEGLRLDDTNPQLHEVLGDLRNREERVEDALSSWRRAFALSPDDRLREKILKAERELQASRDLAFATTPHFNVRYDAVVDVDLANAVIDYLEEQYWVLAERLGHAPTQPITVLLYPTRQFRDVTRSPETVAGLYDGKIRVPLGGLHRIDPRARAVLVHELTHAVVHSKTRGNCPRWLHEGLAQLSEDRPVGAAEQEELRRVLGGPTPPSWEGDDFSYPAALSLVRFLQQLRGDDGLADLLARLGDGLALDGALHDVYGSDYAELCRHWARSVAEGGAR